MYTPGARGADESVDSGNMEKIALNNFLKENVSRQQHISSYTCRHQYDL
jgi:hypothetical protein